MSTINSRGYNDDIFKTRKTRMEVLDDRIREADLFLNSLLPKEKKEELEKNNEINSQEEEKTENIENTSKTQKFITKMEKMIEELNKLKNNNVDSSQIQSEVSKLPPESLIQLSFSKVSVKKEYEKSKKNSIEKDEYIKKLEDEVLKGRIDMEKIKKNESENMSKIATLEDQIRILKSKVFGYDIGKKYEYYKEHQDSNHPLANIQDDKLAFSMWEKENYNSRIPNKLNQMENEKEMWIKNSQNNIDKLVKDVNNANSYNLRNDDPWITKPNNNKNAFDNSFKNNQSSLSGMRRYAPTILKNNKNY
jgi:hypothetical protein